MSLAGHAEAAQIEFQKSQTLHQVEKNKNEARFLNNTGLSCMKRLNLDSAESNFRRAIELAPDYILPHYNLGLVLASEGKLKPAITEFRATLAVQPANPKAHLNLGRALLLDGETGAAIAEFKLALKLQPVYPDADQALKEAAEKRKASEMNNSERREP